MDKYTISEYSVRIENVQFSILIEPKILFKSSDFFENPIEFHDHSYFEFFLVKEGTIFININNYRHHLEKGDSFIISPGKEHRTTFDNKSEWFCFGINYTKRTSGEKNGLYQKLNSAFDYVSTSKFKNCFAFKSRLELLEYYIKSDLLGRDKCIQAGITEIAFLLYDLIANMFPQIMKKNVPSDTGINISYCFKIDTFFQDNYTRDISLEDIAKHLSLSPEQANRIIKRIYNQTFSQKLIYMRIYAAQKYIRDTDLPIDKIAYMAGYSSLNNFYPAFKKISGCTPKEYRFGTKRRLN